MNKYIINRATARLLNGSTRRGFSVVTTIKGQAQYVGDGDVKLRGVHLKSHLNDNPTMIFFPELFDRVENWIPFFSKREHRFLEQRNIYILYPRNVGTSDRADEVNYTSMADDVARFMWEHKISTATLAGHGIGGKLALAAACYHSDRVTGVMALDTAPMNQFYIESYQEMNQYLEYLRTYNFGNHSLTHVNNDFKKHIKCPKWRDIFEDQIVKSNNNLSWNFNLEALARNLSKDRAENLLNWQPNFGLWVGRAMFAFPDWSRYVYLNTHTLPMQKVCTQLKGFNEDIFSIQSDENPLSKNVCYTGHWIYEYEEQAQDFATRMGLFLRHYDGVNLQLKSREEVGNYYVRDIPNRTTAGYFYSDYKPEHLHHNWRFRADVYQQEQSKTAPADKKK